MQQKPNEFSAISCFDLDDTLVQGNSSFHFYFYLCKKGEISFFTLPIAILYYLRFRFFKLSLTQLHEKVFQRMLKGKSLESLEEHIPSFLEKSLSSNLYIPAWKRLVEAKKLGHYTVIISSSPNFLVKKIAQYLGVHGSFASHYVTDAKGFLSQIEKVILGEDKIRIVQGLMEDLKLSLDQVFAYSDSIYDLPLLLGVGTAIGVRPDGALSKICQKKCWATL